MDKNVMIKTNKRRSHFTWKVIGTNMRPLSLFFAVAKSEQSTQATTAAATTNEAVETTTSAISTTTSGKTKWVKRWTFKLSEV